MQIKKNPLRKNVALFLALAAVAVISAPWIVSAETIKKLHPSVQLLWNNITLSGANEGSYTTRTVDLSGGDLDKVSCMVSASTGAATSPTFDIAIEVSPDGGTTWGTAGSFTQITSTGTGVNIRAFKQDLATGPGTKLRVVPDLQDNTSYYNVNLWCLPSVN